MIEVILMKSKQAEIDNIVYKIMHWCNDCPHNDYEESCGSRWQVCQDEKEKLINHAKKLKEEIDKERGYIKW